MGGWTPMRDLVVMALQSDVILIVSICCSNSLFPPFTSSRRNMSFPEGVNSLPQHLL